MRTLKKITIGLAVIGLFTALSFSQREDATADIGVMPGEIFIEAQVSVTFEME